MLNNLQEEKIMSQEEILRTVSKWKLLGKKIVFTNGCFDILHVGHADYLSKAKQLGDVLIVGLNTDTSVKRQGKKGNRPINEEHARAFLLASLHSTDAIVLFEEDTPYDLIKKILPDVLVKGDDYQTENIVGSDLVKEHGGKVVTVPLVKGFSTSSIIEKIKVDI